MIEVWIITSPKTGHSEVLVNILRRSSVKWFIMYYYHRINIFGDSKNAIDKFMLLLVTSYLVSQRATCCFAESGSAFVNWELNVPEESHIVQDDGGDTLRWLWRWACLGDCAKCNKEGLHYFDPLLPEVWSFLFFCLGSTALRAPCPTLFVRFVTLSFFPVRMHPLPLLGHTIF